MLWKPKDGGNRSNTYTISSFYLQAVGELLAVKRRLKQSNQQKMTVQKSTIVEDKMETGPAVKQNDDEIIDPVQVSLC
jgi:hypothetical protein